MHLRTNRQTRILITALAVFALTFTATSGTLEAQSSNQKQTDKLISKARLTTIAIKDTLNQIQRTMGGYNSIISGEASDNQSAFKYLVKDVEACRKEVATVGKRSDSLRKAAAKYFGDWEESLAGFNSEEMRTKAETRMNETRSNYDKIFEVGAEAGDQFDAFITNMDDQVRFLGSALNPSGIADLQDEAEQLNADVAVLAEAIDATIKVSRKYASSLESQ